MARGQPSPFEAAVSESPFFTLPLELRRDIYERLLTQEDGISIPADILKRVKATRQGPVPRICSSCFAVFSNFQDHCRHKCSLLYYRLWESTPDNTPITGVPSLPCISTSILRACRLTHLEASPILYTKNSFYFSNPSTIQSFLWNADHTQAACVQQIIITLSRPYSPYESQFERLSDQWLKYVTSEKAGLIRDIPHLRRIIINLRGQVKVASYDRILPVFQSLAKSVQGLDWVHINGVNDLKLLEHLEPMVSRKDQLQKVHRQLQSHVTEHCADDISSWRPSPAFMQVRRYITESTNAVGWKNATLWWGTGEVPYERGASEPSRYQELLFRRGSGEDDAYGAGIFNPKLRQPGFSAENGKYQQI